MSKETYMIEQDARILSNRIRAYCRSQKDLWTKIPVLALKADGRSGFSERLAVAYIYGLWQIGQVGSWVGMNVNLSSGDLCLWGDAKKPASDNQIIYLAFHLDEVDAVKIIANLEQKATNGIDHSVIHAGKNLHWREDLARELGLVL